jgi:protein TonB
VKNKRIILSYLKGNRKGEAANRVEREAMHDPFLAEALSGYEQHGGNHVRAIKQLQRKVKAQAHPYRRPSLWWSGAPNRAKYINITDREWIDLMFENKNRAYGAYVLRKNSTRRHLLAYALTAACIALLLAFPSMLQWLTPGSQYDKMLAVNEFSDIKMEMPEENITRQFEAPPPPPLKSTIRFTVMRVEEDAKVADEEVKTQAELAVAKEAISIADVQGSDDVQGHDIADLQNHKVVMEAKGDEVFLVGAVEQNPEFPGGLDALYRWISRELKYPAAAQEMGIAGRVTVQFTVWKDGSIRDVSILRGLEASIDKEALRVISKMPKWIPGKQGGRAVAVRYVFPVVFQIK